MRVDGTTPPEVVGATRPAHSNRVLHALSNSIDSAEPVLQSKVDAWPPLVQASVQPVGQEPHDTYRHAILAAPPESAYTSSGTPVETPHVLSGAFETVRNLAREAPHAEIAGLETTLHARGLPLISEPYSDGPVYNGFLEAYQGNLGLDAEASATEGSTRHLDALG